jgi:hypothetical protein
MRRAIERGLGTGFDDWGGFGGWVGLGLILDTSAHQGTDSARRRSLPGPQARGTGGTPRCGF